MATFSPEKSSDVLSYFTSNAIVQRLSDAFTSFQERREALGLSNPGTVDNISREVDRDVFLNNQAFSGLRAEIAKSFSMSPMFQVSHSLSMGSQTLSPYNFAAMYGSPRVFCQGSIDNDFALSGRFNWRWASGLVTKTSAQIAPGQQSMFSIEQDYQGADFTASAKAMNPSILEGGVTGIFVGDYLQSITPRLALGLNAVWQRAAMNQGPETMISYVGRYKGDDWIGTAQLATLGSLRLSYWRRLAEKVEAGVALDLAAAPGMALGPGMMTPPRREGTATIGAKYDFRASSFRAQVDSQGKVSCLLDKRIAPAVQVTFSGEIDHVKSTSKLGLAVQIENAPEELIEQQERGIGSNEPAPPF
ncbi:uncharacterized protein PV09_05245 [Verruconis gallopava]|uniref:Translocase of outer membrane 40 kDa subunit n=1 Tax=Verruconis gallopava TaxID=253628 RepID=A0A0D2A9S2_9PEZI|nr:uncharacterized protein PV09_05245 [Verruconis gallopava]KIW03478.1 hypothetical protein PV09_05245 [Verruconis gallopava]